MGIPGMRAMPNVSYAYRMQVEMVNIGIYYKENIA